MSSKNCEQLQQGEDNRALWERPTVRRLVTEDAEGTGHFQAEGTAPGCTQGPQMTNSCKNAQ